MEFPNTGCAGESYFSPTPLDGICGLSTRASPKNPSDPLTHTCTQECGLDSVYYAAREMYTQCFNYVLLSESDWWYSTMTITDHWQMSKQSLSKCRGGEIGGAGGAWAPPNFSMGKPSPPPHFCRPRTALFPSSRPSPLFYS